MGGGGEDRLSQSELLSGQATVDLDMNPDTVNPCVAMLACLGPFFCEL